MEKQYSNEENERFKRIIDRLVNSMEQKERLVIANRDARVQKLCGDHEKAQKENKVLSMQVIKRQIKARMDEVLNDHVARRLPEMIENGDLIFFLDEDQKLRYNNIRGSIYLVMDAMDSFFNDMQGLLDANGIPGTVKMMREIKTAREAIDKWAQDSVPLLRTEAKDLALDECDKIYEHIKERTEVLSRKANRLLEKLEKTKQS